MVKDEIGPYRLQTKQKQEKKDAMSKIRIKLIFEPFKRSYVQQRNRLYDRNIAYLVAFLVNLGVYSIGHIQMLI